MLNIFRTTWDLLRNTFWFQCYVVNVFEDNEAVIKVIIKGRSPTMRHVSRTHRVALDWLFDKITLDSIIQIRYIDTKHQITDMLTKENFTRFEWNNLLHLVNISHFSSICCAKNSSLISCTKTMTKRMQKQKEEEIIVAKLKSMAMNLDQFIIRERSDCIKKPGGTQSFRKTWCKGKKKFKIRRSVEFSREAERCISSQVYGQSSRATCRNRQKSGIIGVFWIWILEQWRERSDRAACCAQIFWNFREF